jgi:ferritin
MDPALVEALQQHLSLERQASATYFALSIWFAERELRGFAGYMKQESLDEQTHAAGVADYLIARGQSVVLEQIAAPRQNWSAVEEICSAVFQMEADVTSSLQQIHAQAERCADVRTTVFLEPLVEQQLQAEHQAAHLLGRVRFARQQPAALLLIDGELSAGDQQPISLA